MQMKIHTTGFCIALLSMINMVSYAESPRIIAQQTTTWIHPKPSDAVIEEIPPARAFMRSKKNNPMIKGFKWEDSRKSQYAIYRSPGKLYFKGKAGYILEGLEEDLWDMPLQKAKHTLNKKGAVGLGAGYRLSDGTSFEFEYTVNKQDEQQLKFGYKF
ncbi:hypothetical protein MNBD_GAMMA16-671 [hydrothermal vent metagenome]|uniref:Uncharacterized protein n=1 Tax=hydrothermal vent metagenome TaxID=652676 RepID=A0A3B0ZGV1_9ZZZZ